MRTIYYPVLLRPLNSTPPYLINDAFTSAASAPLTSPRVCEPGPGRLTLVQQDGEFSTSSGALQIPAQATATWGDLGLFGEAAPRANGRTYKIMLTTTTYNNIIFGWSNVNTLGSTSGTEAFYASTTSTIFAQGTAISTAFAAATGTEFTYAIVLRSTGAFYLIKSSGTWRLVWVSRANSDTDLYATLTNFACVLAPNELISGYTVTGNLATDNGIATVNVASPVSLASYTGTADQIIECVVTAPSPLANEAGFRYRITDANNYWRCYFNSSGAFRVDRVVAGTPTNVISVNSVISAGQTRTIQVHTRGNTHDGYSFSGTTPTKRGSTVTNSTGASNTTICADIGTDWVVSDLRAYPYTSNDYAALDSLGA